MCSAGDAGSVILISDDEDACYDSSLIIMDMQDAPRTDCPPSPSKVDEDLVITFSRPAELLPHARFDCPRHPFTATDECAQPVSENRLLCAQCFCYICDKLAAECDKWHARGACHCNGHKKSNLWNRLRNDTLLGHLAAFKVTLSEVDGHLRQAESTLQRFTVELRAQMASLMADKRPGDGVSYDCTPAYEYVVSFLNKADQQDGRAAAVMRLGAVREFLELFYAEGVCCPVLPSSPNGTSKWMIMRRLLSALQRQMVMDDFTPEFRQKLQEFYRNLTFPPELQHIRDSLDVRPWEDILLVSVLKGQNVVGVRTNRGKKDTLFEDIDVVTLRVQRLLDGSRFRELSRYLRVVRTNQMSRFDSALAGFLQSSSKASSRATLGDILTLLRVLDTATAPKVSSLCPAGELRFAGDEWCAIPGATPLARLQLVRFAFKVHKCCPAVHANSQFWIHLLKIVHVTRQAPAGLPEPDPAFLQEAVLIVRFILRDESCGNLRIPPHFVSTFPDQAMLLLVSGALSHVIFHPSLSPIVPLLCTFQKNVWALHWFWKDLVPVTQFRVSILQKIYQELDNREVKDASRNHQSKREVLWPDALKCDQLFQLKDFLPFLLCLEGETCEALRMFFPEEGPAARPTPLTFPLYLRLLGSAAAPKLSVARKGELCGLADTWAYIKGAVPLPRSELVHFALKLLQMYPACCGSGQCWMSLLNMVNRTDSLKSIPEPSTDFKQEAVRFADSVWLSFSQGLIADLKIPPQFLPHYTDQAILLLVTKAFRENILHPALTPVVPVLCTFEKSLWALRWFWEYLSHDGRNDAIMEKIHRELRQTTGTPRLICQLLDPSGNAWHQ
ncbi:uncharacterized protein zgc:112980 isoform X2 [Hippocampus zosterae]|uniref:uncharacterized protein zgc:112980 isoform X2 n=1 Tax=Hippocampus zosterae TaxID=109293 RepID=UPI00223D083E|nr:uncharacterized protein zgc:112980 isoform X2 [Hippocampus zosterae]